MRYQNWDVLVFPDRSKIPLQEFKTACQVIQDLESHVSQTGVLLLPTVTSFIPALPANSPFRVSIHSWQNPEITRYIQSMKKISANVVFEARVFIDGRIAGSKCFGQQGPWPTILDLSIDLDKHGEFEKLKFPAFHKELLSQSYWNAGDDLGRVKIIIAEGFVTDSLTYPFERVKNLVSFSFQHAPLDVLEQSSIAWPNAAMWRQVSIVGPYYSRQFSPRPTHAEEDHSHSPRRAVSGKQPMAAVGSLLNQNQPVFPRQPTFDPFTEPVHSAFNNWRHTSSTDVSMPDYSKSNTRANSSRQVTDPMAPEKPNNGFANMQMAGAYESICEALMPVPPAPDNTPANTDHTPSKLSAKLEAAVNALSEADGRRVSGKRQAECALAEPEHRAATATTAMPTESSVSNGVKSRKENKNDSPHTVQRDPSVDFALPSNDASTRKALTFQPPNHCANMRQRVTLAASKVIDDEDEPRSSPSLRMISGMNISLENSKENGNPESEKQVLPVMGGIQSI